MANTLAYLIDELQKKFYNIGPFGIKFMKEFVERLIAALPPI